MLIFTLGEHIKDRITQMKRYNDLFIKMQDDIEDIYSKISWCQYSKLDKLNFNSGWLVWWLEKIKVEYKCSKYGSFYTCSAVGYTVKDGMLFNSLLTI